MLEGEEDVQELKGGEPREESLSTCVCARACVHAWLFVLGGSFNSLLISYAIGSSEMLAPQKVCEHQL